MIGNAFRVNWTDFEMIFDAFISSSDFQFKFEPLTSDEHFRSHGKENEQAI